MIMIVLSLDSFNGGSPQLPLHKRGTGPALKEHTSSTRSGGEIPLIFSGTSAQGQTEVRGFKEKEDISGIDKSRGGDFITAILIQASA